MNYLNRTFFLNSGIYIKSIYVQKARFNNSISKYFVSRYLVKNDDVKNEDRIRKSHNKIAKLNSTLLNKMEKKIRKLKKISNKKKFNKKNGGNKKNMVKCEIDNIKSMVTIISLGLVSSIITILYKL